MRIAIWHNLPSGGGLRVLDDQIRGLYGLGHELHLWSPPTAARCDSSSLATTSRQLSLTLPDRRRGGLGPLRSAWRGRRDDLDAYADHAKRCAKQISGLGPDVVLAHSCQFFRVPAIAQYLDAPSVCYLHEPNRRLYEATSAFPWAARPAARALGPKSLRRFMGDLVRVEESRIQVGAETAWVHGFDEVLVNSWFNRESVLRAYGRLSRVSLPGIDTERFRVQDRPARPRGNVLSVGALVPDKNATFLVRAVAAAGPAVHRFVWVANYVDGPYREVVERAAAEAGVPLDLRCSISEDDLLQCYADADVFVYAPRLEPLGLAPLEASATGLPVVAVAEGGVRETVVDGVNGKLVEHDEACFGAAVAELLAHPERTRALGLSARDHVVRRWALPASIERLEAHLAGAASRSSGDQASPEPSPSSPEHPSPVASAGGAGEWSTGV